MNTSHGHTSARISFGFVICGEIFPMAKPLFHTTSQQQLFWILMIFLMIKSHRKSAYLFLLSAKFAFSINGEHTVQRTHYLVYIIYLATWWLNQIETCSALLAICAGNSPVTGEFPAQSPVTRSFDVSFIDTWINGWVDNREAGDFRRYRAHYEVTVMNAWTSVLLHAGTQGQILLADLAIHGDLVLPFTVEMYWYEDCDVNLLDVFSCDQTVIWLVQSVRPSIRPSVCLSVCPSVTPFSPCSHHRIIMKVIIMDRSDVHAKGQGQRSKLKVTEVNTQLSRFRTLTPVWIHIWQWNHAQ